MKHGPLDIHDVHSKPQIEQICRDEKKTFLSKTKETTGLDLDKSNINAVVTDSSRQSVKNVGTIGGLKFNLIVAVSKNLRIGLKGDLPWKLNPTSSPERNLERSPLFILREKPKSFYSRKKLNSKKSSDSILENLGYNDIEKKNTHNVSKGVVETGISAKYNWDENDNDLFVSISTQEILDQNSFPSTSKRGHKFPANKEITPGNQRNNKNLVLSKSNVALGFQKARLGEGKNELDEVTNKMHQDELGKVNNPARVSNKNKSMEFKFRKNANSREQIANKTGFQTATRKREFQGCLQEKDDKIELNERCERSDGMQISKNCKERRTSRQKHRFSNNPKSKWRKKSTDFQTANGKNVLISEKEKKPMEGLLNEFHRSESDVDIENKLLCLKNKIICKKQGMLSEQKTLKTSSTSRKEGGVSSLNRKYYLLLSKKLSKQINPTSRDHSTSQKEESVYTLNNTETTIPDLGEFVKNADETSTSTSTTRKYLGSRRALYPSKRNL
uniref:Dihydrofolate reductase n=1 Tax=Glossina pallidipes TaxID=7398 RepID=A0A1A9ZHQ2_GLOPL